MRILLNNFCIILLFILQIFSANAAEPTSSLSEMESPITVDKRIKTLIYNENEIYPILVSFGFQTSIEFGQGEEVETISIGDSYAWKINSLGRRIFINPLEENIQTNMTIITNKRVYYFDIISTSKSEIVSDKVAYVVRFYYPKKSN